MTKYLAAYAATLVAMVVLDLLWIGVIAKPLYQQGIGHLMAERPNIAVAILFYLIYAIGVMLFVVSPNAASGGWGRTVLVGALFGLFAYATYDLTNLATLKNWPIGLSVMDMAWGGLATAVSAAAGKAALDRMV